MNKSIFLFFVFFSFLGYAQNLCETVQINSEILVGDDLVIGCDDISNNVCFDVSVTYDSIFTSTTYAVDSIDFTPVASFTSGTPVNVTSDDVWSEIIDIPFTHCFFNQPYDSFVLSDNGVVSFNESLSGQDAPYNINGSIPNINLIKNAIYGVYHDLTLDPNSINCYDDPNTPENECGQITYQIIGEAPCRKVVINYDNILHFACPDSRSSTQIVFYEGSGIIDVYIKSKPLTCNYGREKKATVGVINATGTEGISPEGRNTGIWETQNEAWRFTPNTPTAPTVKWFKNGQFYASGDAISICPSYNEQYTVQLSTLCSGSEVVQFESTLDVVFDSDIPLVSEAQVNVCHSEIINGTINLSNHVDAITDYPNNYSYEFYYTQEDALSGINSFNGDISITNNYTTYYIKAIGNNGCFLVVPMNIRSNSHNFSIDEVIICDEGNDDVFEISNFAHHINFAALGSHYSYSIHTTENHAHAATNAISNATITGNTQYYIRIDHNYSDCYEVMPVSVVLQDGIDILEEILITFCDSNPGVGQTYDLTLYEDQIANGNVGLSFSYYNSEADAIQDNNPIATPNSFYSPTGYLDVYVRVSVGNDEFDCHFIANIKIVYQNVTNADYEIELCDLDGNGSELINILQEVQNAVSTISPFPIPFQVYGSFSDFENQTNPIQLNTVELTAGTHLFYVNLQPVVDCSITFTVVINETVVVEDQFVSMCDLFNDGEETAILANYNSLFGSGFSTITYYSSESNAINEVNPISTVDVTDQGVEVFAKFSSGNCSNIASISFSLESSEELALTPVEYCDTNDDNVETVNLLDIMSQLPSTWNPSMLKFYPSQSQAVDQSGAITYPGAYQVQGNSTSIFVRIHPNFGCYTVLEYVVNLKEVGIPITNQEMVTCDEGNLSYAFDVASMIPYITPNPSQYTVSIHDSYEDMMNDIPTTQNTAAYQSNVEIHNVYVKFLNNEGCYSFGIVTLKIQSSPKVISREHLVCDTNFNGMPDVNLQELAGLVIGNSDAYTFEFYHTYEDASNQTNSISNIDFFEFVGSQKEINIRVTDEYGCNSIALVVLVSNEITTIQSEFLTLENCDDDYDLLTQFDLESIAISDITSEPNASLTYYTSFDEMANEENPITNINTFSITEQGQVIYIRVKSPNKCDNYTSLQLVTLPKPFVEVFDYMTCPRTPIELTVFPQDDDYSYEWFNSAGELVASQQSFTTETPDDYTVVATNVYGCTFSANINLSLYQDPVITEILEGDTDIQVIAEGPGVLEYSIDMQNWQTSNVFTNLDPGIYMIWVRTQDQGCEGIAEATVLFNVPNIFTPNGDGQNDYWCVPNLHVYKGIPSTISMYDRYGKQIFTQSSNVQLCWDGKYQGRALPTGTYYYHINVADRRNIEGLVVVKNYLNPSGQY